MRATSILSFSCLLVVSACHGTTQSTASVEQQLAAPAASASASESASASAEASSARAVLERGVAHEAGITEVWLDPRGEAALTLDAEGGVRLWPKLVSDASASEPYRIPVHEPLWLSLGKRADAGFVLGAIGTNNAGTVYRVDVPAKGPATIVESFALSPEDPLLELHVLDGGERILVLGVDHRVRLYAADGSLISEIDERGFGPWQLRVSGGVGEPPKLAVVLAQPLRIQALRIVDDQLEIAGPARNIELDRGPNRNDLALSPDGTTVAVLRRPHKHDRQWSVELIDLATDARELIAGRVDSKVRPRMHFHRDDRLLLESGSGQAWLVDLSQAVAPRKTEDLHPDSKFAKRLSRQLSHEIVALPASAERNIALVDEDIGIRMHASVVNGVRAAVDVNAGRRLVVGAVDQPTQLSFAHPGAQIVDAAFDASASTVVWASSNDAIYIEQVGDPDSLVIHELELERPLAVALPSRERALVLTRSKVGELDLESGELLSTLALPANSSWTAASRFVPSDGGGKFGYLGLDDASVWLIELGSTMTTRAAGSDELGVWGDLRSVDSRSTRSLCEEMGLACRFGERFARDHAGRAMYADSNAVHLLEGGEGADQVGSWSELEVPGRLTAALVPSPVGPVVAVAKHRPGRGGSLISVFDSVTGELAWTSKVDGAASDLRWSADGTRLAVIGGGAGRVLAAADGRLIHERVALPLEVREH